MHKIAGQKKKGSWHTWRESAILRSTKHAIEAVIMHLHHNIPLRPQLLHLRRTGSQRGGVSGSRTTWWVWMMELETGRRRSRRWREREKREKEQGQAQTATRLGGGRTGRVGREEREERWSSAGVGAYHITVSPSPRLEGPYRIDTAVPYPKVTGVFPIFRGVGADQCSSGPDPADKIVEP